MSGLGRLFVSIGRRISGETDPSDIAWSTWGESRLTFRQLEAAGMTFGSLP